MHMPNRSKNRSREWRVGGHIVFGDETIYFYGKLTAVSQAQAEYYSICDMKDIFKATGMIYPEFDYIHTFDSSSWILRNNMPSPIKYYRDKDRKIEMPVTRTPNRWAIQEVSDEELGI